jgi:hypothetical protein
MKKTLYVHIGAHKTGTSALQDFLSSNRKILETKGYLYPGQKPAHHEMVKDIVALATPGAGKKPAPSLRKYLDEISKSDLNTVILSSEEFEGLGDRVTLLKKIIDNKFAIKIIFYVRRQDDRIESMYNQRVRQEGVRLDKPFTAFIGNGYFRGLDYYQVLLPWCQAFGKENIIVRCYEKEQLPEGIFHDFLGVVGLIPDESYILPKDKVNMSLNWDLIEIIRICNTRFKNDSQFSRFLVEALTEINRDCKPEQRRLLPPGQRREIIQIYEESNANVAREFLGRPDGSLFTGPLPDPGEPWEPYEGLTLEKIVPIFTQMIFNLEKKHARWRTTLKSELRQDR